MIAFWKRRRDDLRTVENAKLSLLSESQLNAYIDAVKRNRNNIADSVSDKNILELMGVTIDDIPTLAGIMVFSPYPQVNFPQLLYYSCGSSWLPNG